MSHQEIVLASNHLRLLRFAWVTREKRYMYHFDPGFNLISDLSQIERTTVLRLIRYAMGGSFSRISDEVMSGSEFVALEMTIGDEVVTTRRGFASPSGRFSRRIGDQEVLVTPDEMSEFMLERIGIPRVRYQRGATKAVLSFNDFARCFVVDRDFGYTEILARMFPEQRKEVVKLALGVTTQEIADLSEELADLSIKVQRRQMEIEGVESFLRDLNVPDLLAIEQRKAELEHAFADLDERERNLRREIQVAMESGDSSKTFHGAEYRRLTDELIRLRQVVEAVEAEIAALSNQVVEKRDLEAVLVDEREKLQRNVAARYVLSTFTFAKCPRCQRPIDTDMRAREEEGHCSLCDRTLSRIAHDDDASWDKALRDSEKSIEEVSQLISYYELRIDALAKERETMRSRIVWIESELTRQSTEFVAPYVEEIGLISFQRNEIVGELGVLTSQERQRRQAERLRDVVLPELRGDLDALKRRLDELNVHRASVAERTQAFLSHYTAFMRRCASGAFRFAEWDEDDMLPKINGQVHTRALTAFDLPIAVLGFHYALLAVHIEDRQFESTHPGLLIIDEPEQQMMGFDRYQRIMTRLSELAAQHGQEAQIIVAATEPAKFDDYRRPVKITDRSDRAT